MKKNGTYWGDRMSPSKRKNEILQTLHKHGKVKIDDLSQLLDVSSMTIRRDLDILEKEGELIRIHGGAVLAKPLVQEVTFTQKESMELERKKDIAKKAVTFVKDGQTILLDSGTTTLEIAKLLKTRNNITVITNDIHIASFLLDSELKVIVTGGELQNNVGTLYGPQTDIFLQNVYVDILFLGAPAVDIKAGVTTPTLEKAMLKQLMIKAAEATWLVADTTKLDTKAFAKVCDLKELTGFITDDSISDEQTILYTNYIKII